MSETPILNRDGTEQEPIPEHDPFGRTPPEGPNQPGGPHDPPSSPRARAWIAGGVAAAVLATGGFFGVQAVASHTKSAASATAGPGGGFGGGGFGGGGPGGGGTVGTIKSINGSSLVVTTSAGATETVNTTSATTVTKSVTGAASDIKAGDHVVVLGTGTTAIAATSVTDSGTNAAAVGAGGAGAGGGAPGGGQGGPPAGGGPRGGGANGFGLVSGTVADVGSGTLTVTETDGTKVTVTVSSSTTVANLQTISVADLSVGQAVTVRGTTTNGTVSATAIQEGAATFGQGGAGAPGGQPVTQGA